MHGRRLTTAFLLILALIGCGETEQVQTGDEVSAPPADAPAASASALTEVGTIRGTLGDEDRTWTALYIERDGEPNATSTYQTRTIGRMEVRTLSLGGHVGPTLSPGGSLRITSSDTRSFEDCPCTLENQTIEYWINLPDDGYETNGATVTIDRFASSPDGTYEVEGSFAGTLVRPEGETGEALDVEGTFAIRRIVRVGER